VVILNFAFAEPIDATGSCKPEDIYKCRHIRSLGRDIFGEECEVDIW
jgi:hypothetical protein